MTISRENKFNEINQQQNQLDNLQQNSSTELAQAIQDLVQAEVNKQMQQNQQVQSSQTLTQQDFQTLQKSFQTIIKQQNEIINLLTYRVNGKTYNWLNLIDHNLETLTTNISSISNTGDTNAKNLNANQSELATSMQMLTTTVLKTLLAVAPETGKLDKKAIEEMLENNKK